MFALTGLISRGGLSNWVFFFGPARLVMIDIGMTPALSAGVHANLIGEHTYGPSPGGQGLEAWSAQLRAKAKNVVELQCEGVRSVELRLRMLAHELVVDGKTYGLMNRNQADGARGPLEKSFGPRFKVTKTAAFGFFERYAPFLLR